MTWVSGLRPGVSGATEDPLPGPQSHIPSDHRRDRLSDFKNHEIVMDPPGAPEEPLSQGPQSNHICKHVQAWEQPSRPPALPSESWPLSHQWLPVP